MKKYVKYIVLIIIILSIFGIYYFFKNDKLNYIALGDSLVEGINSYGEKGYSYSDYLVNYFKENNKLSYFNKYAKSGYRTIDIINDIRIKNDLKKDLRESNLVTISIGANDFLNSFNIRNLDRNNILELKNIVINILPDVEDCIKEIRKYAKQDIIIVGYYNPIPFLFNTNGNDLDILFAFIDDEYKKIANKYKCEYLSIYQLFKNNSDYLPNPSNIHPSLEGYKSISDEIIENYISKKNT